MVYEGNAWLGYDRRFRQAVAVNPQMQWSRTDTDLWHLAFTSMVKRPRCAHCSSLTHKSAHCGWAQDSPERTTSAPNSGSWYYSQADPKPYYSGICRFWNRDPRLGCSFPNCKFQHICSFCSRHQLNTTQTSHTKLYFVHTAIPEHLAPIQAVLLPPHDGGSPGSMLVQNMTWYTVSVL